MNHILTLLLLRAVLVPAFLPRKAFSSRPTTTEFHVSRAETRTTDSVNLHDDIQASIFTKLCNLLSPEQQHLVRIDQSTDGVRGVYSSEKILKGSVILSIPLQNCLRDDDIPFWMGEEAFDDDLEEVDSYTASSWAKRLAGSLIDLQLDARESLINEDSELWLALLPEASHLRATLPVHWPEEVVQSARCSSLELAVDSAYFARAQAVHDLLEALERCDSAEHLDRDNLREMVDNALDLVQTRTCRVISPDDGTPLRVLAPLFDLLNHGNRPTAAFTVEQVKSPEDQEVSHDALVVRAIVDIPENTEILINYGSSTKPSWRCLASYGFVPTFNPSATEEEEYEEEDDEDEEMTYSAEVFLEGMRYQVGPDSVSQELVDAMAECIDPMVQKPALFTPQIALRLAQRISEASFQMLLDASGTESLDTASIASLDEDEYDDEDDVESSWSLSQIISARLAAALRWNQHRILMSCSLGLRDWAEGQTHFSV